MIKIIGTALDKIVEFWNAPKTRIFLGTMTCISATLLICLILFGEYDKKQIIFPCICVLFGFWQFNRGLGKVIECNENCEKEKK